MNPYIIGRVISSKRLMLLAIGLIAFGTAFLVATPIGQSNQSRSESSQSLQINKPSGKRESVQSIISRDRIVQKRVSLRWLLITAYAMPDYQISGGPDWIDENLYNIDIKSASPNEDVRIKLRELINEKFQLRFHNDECAMPVLSLTVAQGGPKFENQSVPAEVKLVPGQIFYSGSQGIFSKAITMNRLADQLSGILHRKVLDKTGIYDLHDVIATWGPDENRPAILIPMSTPPIRVEPEVAYPIIFKALEQQVGLKLQPDKSRGICFVIDRAEKPSEN